MRGKHLPLAMINPSEEVTVAEIRGGRGLVQRLADMGLTPGTKLKVINSQMPGPILIDLRGCFFMGRKPIYPSNVFIDRKNTE